MVFEHGWKGSINYEPSNSRRSYREDERYLYSTRRICGRTQQQSIKKTLNFKQAGETYRSFSVKDRANLVQNLAADLMKVRSMLVRNTMCAHFYKADTEYGTALSKVAKCDLVKVQHLAKKLRE